MRFTIAGKPFDVSVPAIGILGLRLEDKGVFILTAQVSVPAIGILGLRPDRSESAGCVSCVSVPAIGILGLRLCHDSSGSFVVANVSVPAIGILGLRHINAVNTIQEHYSFSPGDRDFRFATSTQ